MKFNLSHTSEKGTRPYQEDTKVVYWLPDEGYILGVFDGHSGPEVSRICANRLIPLVHEVRKSLPVMDYETLLKTIFASLNSETEHLGAGSTASIAFIPKDGKEAIVGVLGDSPVLVRKADGELWLSPEHNIRSNIAEATAARQRGGYIAGGYLFAKFSSGGLQMSRALGDTNLSSVLSREPEIFRLPLGPGSFVLVASDGLFDPAHAADLTPILTDTIGLLINEGADAAKLVQNSLNVPTNDNVTAILVKLED